jgi:tRNA pseudouridine synthase 10
MHEVARGPHDGPESPGAGAEDGGELDLDGRADGAGAEVGSESARLARVRAGPRGGDEPARPQVKLYIEGRYRKLVRDLPQTVFFCPECKGHPRRRRKCERCEGFGKLTRDSVQELVAWVAGGFYKTRKQKFHGAGREDVDVRMLGEGRPFVLELVNPKELQVDLAEVEAEINRRNAGRLEVRGLHHADKSRVRFLKETPHSKEYGVLVALEAPVDDARLQALVGPRRTIVQQTPARVAHRRADKARERWIEITSVERREELLVHVVMRTEHGTYVKEAVNGEGGATRPSLTELLGVPCRCAELDVLAILDFDAPAPPAGPREEAFGAGL